MKQSKKIGWVSALFVLMASLHPGIVGAYDSTTLSFPGDGYVGVCLHDQIPEFLAQAIYKITGQTEMTHCWVTATVNGVHGVIHSDGLRGVHFLSWPELLNLCKDESIRLFRPNKTAIGFAEIHELGINLYGLPPIFRQLIALRLGNLMINSWLQKMLAYRGVPYDLGFQPEDNDIYCSELMAHGWNNTGAAFELFPSQKADTLDGWGEWSEVIKALLGSLGYTITENTDVYDLTYILSEEIRPYFTEISVN
ncbi:hypothetical protein [uncultured Desulfobacter sp.]|uniref:hypothetical protein n=1 Tax=uncultured Desulfobacter sp. TaxID=240139 RepID=UPI0029F52512|nr:hypothetical protein [uncultured Desulfobacter sp.]